MTYAQAVRFLETFTRQAKHNYMEDRGRAKRIYLERMEDLMRRLGNPERKIPHLIHVTGTSGKGTVSMAIGNVLHASEKHVGVYTSPHLTTTIERYWINGVFIAPREFASFVSWIKPTLEACAKTPIGCPSYFETCAAIAFEYFRRKKCEYVIIEVGCGGEYDATNVMPAPDVAIITNIGEDHQEILGHTPAAIARTKSGIIKKGSHVYTMEPREKVRDVMKKRARALKAPFRYVKGGNFDLVRAVAVDLHIPSATIEKGIGATRLPGRFEIVSKTPLTVLDVAHNPDKICYLVATWRNMGYPKPHILFGVLADKEYVPMLKTLLPIARSITFTPFKHPARHPVKPAILSHIAHSLAPDIPRKTARSPKQGFAFVKKLAAKNEPILVCGSFFLVSMIRPMWYPESRILKRRQSF